MNFHKDPLSVLLVAAVMLLAMLFVVMPTGGPEPGPGGGAVTTPAPTPTPTPTVAGTPSHDGADLRTESGMPASAIARNARAAAALDAPAARKRKGKRIAPKCRSDFSGGVWSSRNGARPVMFVLHYTVSANRPGWADILAVLNYFETTRRGSSHFIVDFDGNCLKMVRGRDKAWTQGNANPWALSVEIIATGRESKREWKQSPLFKDRVLARLARSVMDAWGVPVRRVNPVGCVFPAGWTDHNSLECGNFHTDVMPNFPYGRFSRQLKAVR